MPWLTVMVVVMVAVMVLRLLVIRMNVLTAVIHPSPVALVHAHTPLLVVLVLMTLFVSHRPAP